MAYDIKSHSRAINRIVSDRSERRGTVFLNFANEDHYRCISEMFGGEDYFKKEFPRHYLLAQKTRQDHAANKAITAESVQQGFRDYTEVLDVSYKKTDRQLYSCGYANLVGKADKIYQILYVFRNDELIDNNESFSFESNYNFIDKTTIDIDPLGGQKDELTIIINTTWIPERKDVLFSAISYDTRDSLKSTLDEVVKDIEVVDPRHKASIPDEDILVAYGRSAPNLDYSYPCDRIKQNQKVYLENRGKVTLKDGVRFMGGEVKETLIVLNHEEKGAILYSSPIPENAISRIDDTHFEWSIDEDWDNQIPESVIAGTRSYKYGLHLFFYALGPGDDIPKLFQILVSSLEKPPNPHYKHISCIKLQWGCLAEDSLVRMVDGSTKTIRAIAIGDRVMGLGGKSLSVTNVWTGMEKEILRIIMEKGNEISATEKHPFMTREGMKPIISLSIGDELLMEDGNYSAIDQCYPEPYGRTVYNLDVEGGGPFICNGFVVGDNTIQNSCQIPANEAETDPAILIEAEKLKSIYSRIK